MRSEKRSTVRLLSLGMAAMLAVMPLVGCNSSGGSEEGVDVITIWSGDSHSQDFYDELVKEWNETDGKEKGIKIDYQVKGGDTMKQSLDLALQNGDAPDMFVSTEIKKYSELGYIAALEDLPGGQDILDKYAAYIREDDNRYRGKTYSVPVAATTRGIIYNKDMFVEAGIVDENGEAKPPVTYDEMREYAAKLTDKANNKYGIALPMKWSGWFNSDILTAMYPTCGHSGYNTATGKYDYTKMIDIMQCFIDMKNDGSIYPAPETLDNDTARAYFAEGIIGMKIAYSWDVGVLNEQFPAKCDWGVAPMVVVDANEQYNQKMTQTHSFLVNAKSAEDEEKAAKMVEVLKFFTGDKFVSEAYKQGLQLPVNEEIANSVELGDDAPKGWKEFAKLVSISEFSQRVPGKIMDGKASLQERFANDVFSGKMSPEQMVEEYTADVTEATEIWYNQNPEENRADYVSVLTQKR